MEEGQTRKEFTIGETLDVAEIHQLADAVANLALAGLRFMEAGASERYNQALVLADNLMKVIDTAIIEEDVPVEPPA